MRPGKFFKAFDYGAEFIFMDHIVESLQDFDPGSDSDSQEEAEHVKKNKFRERYYVPGSNMFLLNENVSYWCIFLIIFISHKLTPFQLDFTNWVFSFFPYFVFHTKVIECVCKR